VVKFAAQLPWVLESRTGRSQRPNKADDRAGCKTLFLLHSQTYETYILQSEISREFFTIFANLSPPPSKCRLVRPAPPRSPLATPLIQIIDTRLDNH